MQKDDGKTDSMVVVGDGDAVNLSLHGVSSFAVRNIGRGHGQGADCDHVNRRIQFTPLLRIG